MTGMPSLQPNIGLGTWRQFGLRFWLSLVAAAVATGFAAGLLMRLLHWVQQLAWGNGTGDFLDAVERAGAAHRIFVVLGAGVLVVGTRWLLRLRGSGHGGELAAAIWFRAGHLPVLGTLLNAVASIIIVALGASLGREAAPKQTGALFAGLLAQWARLPPPQRRLLAACGAGAGIGAVYNVPFGGALFALEVLLGTLSFSLVAPALATSLIATACAWLLLPDQPTYFVPSHPMTPQLLTWSVIAGPVLGIAAALYVRLICWADARKPAGWFMFVAPLAVFAALGAASIPFPQLLGNGKDVVELAFTGSLPLLLALCLAGLKPVATAACLGSGAPGGLFTPTLTVGALLGVASAEAWTMLWPGGPPEAGACALIGAGAFLAASTQGPLSAVALLLELTRRLDSTMVPLMLAIAGAMLVARSLEARSIYSGRIHAAREAVPKVGGKSISAAARTPELLRALLAQPHSELDVIDQDGRPLGSMASEQALTRIDCLHPDEIVTARDLLLVLQKQPIPATAPADAHRQAAPGDHASAAPAAIKR
jgi:chloride channel protein, CIC family